MKICTVILNLMLISTMLLIPGHTLSEGGYQEIWTGTHQEPTSPNERPRETELPFFLGNYTPREPVRIDGDSDFSDQGWPGDGTQGNPFVIEGYEIDGEGRGNPIYIGNTSLHFVVRECYLHTASGLTGTYSNGSGLYLYNTTNGQITGNVIAHNQYMGVHLFNSYGNIIHNNTLFHNGIHEIYMEKSYENHVYENHLLKEEDQERVSTQKARYCPTSVLVRFEESYVMGGYDKGLLMHDTGVMVPGSVSQVYPTLGMARVELEGDVDVHRAVAMLNRMEGVIHAEPNYILELMNVPDDPYYDRQWGMEMIFARSAWGTTTGSRDVVVAVIDTGIDYNHVDLADNMWRDDQGKHGYNALNDSYYPMDDNGHGTHVSGIIGAVGNNGIGVTGVNWEISLMGVKAFGPLGEGTVANVIAGLDYVLERKNEGENIVATSNSWGGFGFSELLYEAIQRHQEADILFIAAAGNDGLNNDIHLSYPSCFNLTNIISVGSTTSSDHPSWSSDYGPRTVHVSAPGQSIYSTYPYDDYTHMSGTSMATPHVSGLAALLASYKPSYDHIQLKNTILSSADTVPALTGLTLTGGRINAYNALYASPDPDDINIWVHRPLSSISWGGETDIMISLNDGVDPVTGAHVAVEFGTGEPPVILRDDGTGGDQVADDGYYFGKWTPETVGTMVLTVNATIEGTSIFKEFTIDVSGESGIYVLESQNNTLEGNEISGGSNGVILRSSLNNTVSSNEMGDNNKGVVLHDSDLNRLMDNTVRLTNTGILLESSTNNTLENNTVELLWYVGYGVALQYSDHNTIVNSSIEKGYEGMVLQGSSFCAITGMEFFDTETSLGIYESNHNVIRDITVQTCWEAVLMIESHGNEIFDFVVDESYMGIACLMSNHNTFRDISLSGGYIYNVMSSHNSFYDCSVQGDMIGFYLVESLNILLSGNTMVENGILLSGSSLENWNTHTIDSSNTVNNKPVYYWKNRTEGTVPDDAGQVILANCTGVTVEGVQLGQTTMGITMGFSRDNTVRDNHIYKTFYGIFLEESHDNLFLNNTIEDGFYGMISEYSDGNEVEKNSITNNLIGMLMFFSHNNSMTGNTVTGNDFYSIACMGSNDNKISDNVIRSQEVGIVMYDSHRSVVSGNRISHTPYGIRDFLSTDSVIMNNNLSYNHKGGMFMEDVHGSLIVNNTIYNSHPGIIILGWDCTLRDNTMEKCGIDLRGYDISNYNSHSMDESNTINGKPLIYWKDTAGGEVPQDAGQVILVSCTGVVVENQWLEYGCVGITLAFSYENILRNNTLSMNRMGVYLTESSDNILYHNNFKDNTVQAEDNGENTWNLHYPVGGNHWSHWTEPDVYSGPDQGVPGSDGIVDEPYHIGRWGVDVYPWVAPNGWNITRPSLVLTRPEGGEVFGAGTREEIIWETTEGSHNITGVTLEYSINAGDTWIHVVETEDTGSFTWDIPNITSNSAMIRATVRDEMGLKDENTSGIFEIRWPELDLYGFQITPNPVAKGSNATVRMSVSNEDETITAYETILLRIDGVQNDSRELVLDPGENKTVEFLLSGMDVGAYDIGLWSHRDGVLVFNETLEVLDPPRFTYPHFDVNPKVAKPGTNIIVTVGVQNRGGMAGQEVVEFRVNGELTDTREVYYEPYENELMEFLWVGSEPGDHSLEIWSGTEGTMKHSEMVTILRPAELVYSDFNVHPTSVITGEKVRVNVTVENVGEVEGTLSVEFKVNGTVFDTRSVQLEPNEVEILEFTWSESTPGVYLLQIGDHEQEVVVEAEEGFIPSLLWLVITSVLILVMVVIAILVLLSLRKKGGKVPEPVWDDTHAIPGECEGYHDVPSEEGLETPEETEGYHAEPADEDLIHPGDDLDQELEHELE